MPHSKALSFDLPVTISIGPQRSATSWIDRYLRARGDICLPSGVKEIFYFDRHYDRGINFYKSHFIPKPNHRILSEITTTSFDFQDAPARVRNVWGTDIKLLCPLRRPIERSYSLYRHYLRYGLATGGLQDVCEDKPEILTSSHYARHLENWFNIFGQQSVQIMYLEDLKKNRTHFVHDLCARLDIPFISVEQNVANRYNGTALSRSGTIARFAQRGADWLRQHRIYGPINVAKAMGLKKIIFGYGDEADQYQKIPANDYEWLHDKLHGEIEKLEALIGPIPQWR